MMLPSFKHFRAPLLGIPFIFIFFNPHPWICLLILEREEGRGGERERETSKREKHWSVATHTCPDGGIEPTTFWGIWWCSNHQSHLARTGIPFQFLLPSCSNFPFSAPVRKITHGIFRAISFFVSFSEKGGWFPCWMPCGPSRCDKHLGRCWSFMW